MILGADARASGSCRFVRSPTTQVPGRSGTERSKATITLPVRSPYRNPGSLARGSASGAPPGPGEPETPAPVFTSASTPVSWPSREVAGSVEVESAQYLKPESEARRRRGCATEKP
jgi:hypothetical protein